MEERAYLKLAEEYNRLEKRAEKYGGFTKELWFACKSWSSSRYIVRAEKLEKWKTLDDFWNKEFTKAVDHLVGKSKRKEIQEITELAMEGQYSNSMLRRSFRSKHVRYHVSSLYHHVMRCIYFTAYELDVCDVLSYSYWDSIAIDDYLALKLRKNDKRAVECVKEAILGDNSEIILTTSIIRAVVISGHEELMELLCKLLVAARLQEGLRQQILEQADAGSMETFLKIWKTCLDEDLFRYSSFVRALGTWTGIAYDNEKPAMVQKYAQFAYECLTDEEKRLSYTQSENNMEAYYALWAIGCYETEDCDAKVMELLSDERKYRKVLGWYFVSNYDNSVLQMEIARRFLGERDEELMAWIIQNLTMTGELFWYNYNKEVKMNKENFAFPSKKENRMQLMDDLKEMLFAVGNKKTVFTGNPFPFSQITLDNERLLNCMLSLAWYDCDKNHEICMALKDAVPYMDSDQKKVFYYRFCRPETIAEDREIIVEALSDRAVTVKEFAVKILEKCRLSELELKALGDALKSKSSNLRKAIIDVFTKQDMEALKPVICDLLHAKSEAQVQAALELILAEKENDAKILKVYQEELEQLKERKISSQTQILLEQLQVEEEKEELTYCAENGYGLYDTEYTKCLIEPVEVSGKLMTEKEMKAFLEPDKEELHELTERMSRVFDHHADYEYEVLNWDGTREKVLFGSMRYNTMPFPAETGIKSFSYRFCDYKKYDCRIERLPFHEEFLEAMGAYGKDAEKFLTWYLACMTYQEPESGYLQMGKDAEYRDWMMKYAEKIDNKLCSFFPEYQSRYWQISDTIKLAIEKVDQKVLFEKAFTLYRSLVAFYGEENLAKNYIVVTNRSHYYQDAVRTLMNIRPIGLLRSLIQSLELEKEEFKAWFLYEYRLETLYGGETRNYLSMEEYFKACEEGVIQRDAMYERLFVSKQGADDIGTLTWPGRQPYVKKLIAQYPCVEDILKNTVSRISDIEEKRGEAETQVTRLARNIAHMEGAEHFVNLLAALGKENFFRGYLYSSDNTKQAILSRLLKSCYPAKSDTPEKLKELLKQTDISEKRLAEAVMYAPQWAGFAEKILGWKGLKMAVWFFHAHINENFSAEKETEVALYSPITPQQFNDGAFDKNWFFKAYETLGEKRFQILYKAAKYITEGSNQHRRSQLYSDAVLGKLDAEALKTEIIEKRNQEKLRCYPLIPLGEVKTTEALARYEFIQKFLKESRQFGAQRKESEKKACLTALANLAITMGFPDVDRMTWFLESEKMEEIRPLMERKSLDGTDVWLEISEDGTPELAVEKNGKRLKSVPKALNKNETILLLKETIKELRDQKSRARKSLEQAMVDCTEFEAEELVKIANNPVLAPMLFSLVWLTTEENRTIGFIHVKDGTITLEDIKGQSHILNMEQTLRLAHPYDFMQAKVWPDYMHKLYEEKRVQPFKQVFREYYPITEDELQEKNVSRRYAGHQVQPQKTVALLKNRGWTVDYEEGLQKVCYHDNIIVRMYALADWFSPADMEAPTLEVIHFYDRDTGELLDFEKVPPILFSEAMRDMDLVVSVAHVGGVDPEASHSTVEMRTAMAQELAALMKLTNVSFIGSHAKVEGSMANYSVHMGSGVVHGEGIGMIAILPVHSQARGRIFLPFADDDPKTAEIMSKIVLLSDDKKIKDPAILRQIK